MGGRHMPTKPALWHIAERIARNTYWEGPYVDGSKTTWFASIPQASQRQEIAQMTLTEDRLIIWDDRLFSLGSVTTGAVGEFTLPGSSLTPAASEFGSQPRCVVTFGADGQISVEGPGTHLMLLLLAHGLRE